MTRLELIKREMAEQGIDAIYLTSPENHRYACGFNNPDGQVLVTKNKSYVFAEACTDLNAFLRCFSVYNESNVDGLGLRIEQGGRVIFPVFVAESRTGLAVYGQHIEFCGKVAVQRSF